MKNWTSRFAVLMVAGAIMCSALMVGCGGNSEEEGATNAVNNAAPAKADDMTKPE